MGGDADLLICGSCQQDFHLDNLSGFLAHKKFDCDINDQSYLSLLCQSCPEKFASPWQLLQHAQRTHAIKIYQDNRLIKQPDKTATFTAAQSYVQAMFEDGRNGTVMEYSPPKSQTYMVDYRKDEDEMVKAESGRQSASPLKERNGSEDRHTTDAATQVDDPLTEEKETAQDDGGYCCCSNQNCGVTVMPGTHERLKECCNAVVPKKRKRHMETKHIPLSLLRKKKFFEGTKVRRSDTGDIYIDVETSGPSDISNERENCQRQTNPDKSTSGPSPIRDAPQRTLTGLKQKSVIIQPGTTFSIPVSYAVVQQPMLHTKSRSSNATDKPHTLTRTSIASSKVSDRPVIIVDSSQIAIPMKPTSEPSAPVDNSIGRVSLSTLPFSVQSSKPISGNQLLLDNQSHPVPFIANQLFSRPQEVVANNSVSNSTDKDPASVTDQTTNEVLSVIMAMNKDASEGESQVVVESESGYEDNLVIDNTVNTDALEPVTEHRATASSCGENQVLIEGGETSVMISEDTTQDSHGSYDLKSELVMADADASQSGDSKSMKKRRYPTSRPFKCDQCNQAFNQRIHLRKHQSKHTGIKPFKCGQCDYSTVERSHLKVHIRVHTGEKPYKCTYCEYATAQNSTLKIHLKRHHDGEGGSGLMCRTCGKKFKQQENLEVHYRQHSLVKEH